jgi:hypothetical protein
VGPGWAVLPVGAIPHQHAEQEMQPACGLPEGVAFEIEDEVAG